MKLTRERKIYAGVLVLAVAALGFDLLGSDSSASDSASPAAAAANDPSSLLLASAPAPAAVARNSASAGTSNSDGPSLAQRLAAAAPAGAAGNPDQLRDVFRIPRAWLGNGAPVTLTTDTASLAAEKFLQTHKLTAVSRSGNSGAAGESVAVVDGKLLHPGAVIDGFKLLNVTRTSVIFDSGGTQVVLLLKSEPAAATASGR